MLVRVLGGVEVRASTEGPWTALRPQQQIVVAVLVAASGQPCPVDRLVDAVWGGDPPPSADRLLQALLSRVRSVLDEPEPAATRLPRVSGGWQLQLDPDDVDVAAFERLSVHARELADRGERHGARAALEEALMLWRGRPFGAIADHPLLVGETSRLEEQHLDAQELLLELRLADGEHVPVVAALQERLEQHPLRERLWALLMEALYRSGRQADALAAFHKLRERLDADLGVEPDPTVKKLHERILRQELDHDDGRAEPVATLAGPSQSRRSASRLPAPPTRLVGRRAELDELDQLLNAQRLVTLVGPGGVGKTRLALAGAHDTAARFPAGVDFIDLAPAAPETVAQAVARGLGLVERLQRPVEEVVHEHLGHDRRLLVLDNCEHVVAAAAAFVERLLRACPDAAVLVTSRQRLGAPGEHVMTVPPLSLTVADHDGEQPEAVTLFLERAAAVDVQLSPDPELAREVCTRLDGLPLAIELAAARCASLGVDGLLAGLDDRLRLLDGAHGWPGRHRSLRAVLDWSHDLLDEDERAAFRRLAVFAGDVDLDAAAAVILGGAHRQASATVADLVGRLTDKNLLTHRQSPTGSRWRMLQTVRSYALERLAASGEEARVRQRHRRWATQIATALHRRLESGGAWREEFDIVAGDLGAALQAEAPGDDGGERLSLALSLAGLDSRVGAFTHAQAAYEQAIALARATGDAAQLARAALGASVQGMLFGVANDERIGLLEEALSVQPPDAHVERGRLLARLATELYWSKDRSRSRSLAEQATALAATLDDAATEAYALHALHYVDRGPDTSEEQLARAARVVELAERAEETQLELAGRAAHVVELLAAGDLPSLDAHLARLSDAAERMHHPEFRWYATIYQLVRALLEGRFADADALAVTARAAGRHAPEFSIGLFFAVVVTDLRALDDAAQRQRREELGEMARRFPSVRVWRCLQLLHQAGAACWPPAATAANIGRGDVGDEVRDAARTLCDELVGPGPRDAHWLVACCLLAELVAALDDAELASPLACALGPYAGRLAVAGRVAAFRGSVSHALGLLARALGQPERAVAELGQAVAAHRRLGARPYLGRSLAELAHTLEGAEDPSGRSRAHAARQEADALAHQLGLRRGQRSG